MESISSELNAIIDKHLPALRSVAGEKFDFKPSPSRWSRKEIVGHLIDSAQNNIRRFLAGQYEERPKIVYNQDKWVALTNYQGYDVSDLIDLWHLLNKHICQVLKSIEPEALEREVETGEIHTIKWLASDYIKHLVHHLHQVLDLEPLAYP